MIRYVDTQTPRSEPPLSGPDKYIFGNGGLADRPFIRLYSRRSVCFTRHDSNTYIQTDALRRSQTNSGSSLTSILYRDTCIVIIAIPSVSKYLKEICENSITRQQLTASPQTSTGTCKVVVGCTWPYDVQRHTLAEWDKRVLRPVTKESLGYEPVRLLPVSFCKNLCP